MSMKWKDNQTASRFERAVRAISKRVLEEERPKYKQAYVVSVDAPNRVAVVKYSGETGNPVPVDIGAVVPTEGQRVTIDGLPGDRHITEVLAAPFDENAASGSDTPVIVPVPVWETATGYNLGDLAMFEGTWYLCLKGHISTDFTTDLGSWQKLFGSVSTSGLVMNFWDEASLEQIISIQIATVANVDRGVLNNEVLTPVNLHDSQYSIRQFEFEFLGASPVPVDQERVCYVPYDLNIEGWVLYSDIDTTCVIDVWQTQVVGPPDYHDRNSADSMVGSGVKPHIDNEQRNIEGGVDVTWDEIHTYAGHTLVAHVVSNDNAGYLKLVLWGRLFRDDGGGA